MPALAPAPHVARVAVAGLCDAQNIVNVFHVQQASVAPNWTQADINGLATNFSAAFKARFQSSLSNNYSFKSCTATDLSSNAGVVGVSVMTGAGSAGTVVTPNSTCACVSWKIPLHYRGGHPRTYIGPLNGSHITTGTTLLAAFVTSLQAAADLFITDISAIVLAAGAVRLGSLHRVRAGVQLLVPEFSIYSASQVDSRVDCQRRRLGKDR